MQLSNNKLFQVMLRKTKKDCFNNSKITILNNKIAKIILIWNANEQFVIVE